MRSSPKPHALLIWLLAFLLAGSIAANWILFRQGRGYYEQLNALRLDPVGLSHYGTAAEQHVAGSGQVTVVLFGDSRAAQWPAPALDGFAFVNRGIGAETSAQSVQRFDAHVFPLSPDVVVVQVGVNDLKTIPLFPERTEAIVANCQANIRQIVEKAADLDAQVILTTIFPLGRVPLTRLPFWSEDASSAVDQVNAYIRSLEGPGIKVLDAFAVLADEQDKIQSAYSQDMLHLSTAGYEALNRELVKTLEALNDRWIRPQE
jgi:lysophospholipase L1-like esterase